MQIRGQVKLAREDRLERRVDKRRQLLNRKVEKLVFQWALANATYRTHPQLGHQPEQRDVTYITPDKPMISSLIQAAVNMTHLAQQIAFIAHTTAARAAADELCEVLAEFLRLDRNLPDNSVLMMPRFDRVLPLLDKLVDEAFGSEAPTET